MNNKNKKRLSAIMTAILLITLSLNLFAASIPDADEKFYVDDFANVIDSTTEDAIVNQAASLYENYAAQIVIVTVNNLGGADIADYAKELFNKWGIGDSATNYGVLFLMVIDEENYYGLTGRGLENIVNAGTLGYIQQTYVEPYFAEGDYSGSATAFFSAMQEELTEKLSPLTEEQKQHTEKETKSGGYSWGTDIIIAIVVIIVFLILKKFIKI